MKTGIHTLFILVFIIIQQSLWAQDVTPANVDCDTIMDYRDLNGSTNTQPYYYGGDEAIKHFLSSNANPSSIICGQMPAKARLFIIFDVDKYGNPFNLKILRINRVYYDEFDKDLEAILTPEVWAKDIDIDYCQKEAFRVVNLLKYNPAKRNGVNCCYRGMVVFLYVEYPANAYD